MMRRTMSRTCLTALVSAVAWSAGMTSASAEPPKSIDVYPLSTCVVTGGKLGSMGAPVVKTIADREFRFCCAGCVAKVEADPAAFAKKLDDAVAAREQPLYPLDTCLVMEKKLDPASTIEVVRGGRLFRLCCADCVKEVASDPAKYRALLDSAAAGKQRAVYPLKTCIISGKTLSDTPVEVVAGGRLIRLCCPGCVAAVEKDPAKALKQIDASGKAGAQAPEGPAGAPGRSSPARCARDGGCACSGQ